MGRKTLRIAGALLVGVVAGCGEPAPQDEAVPVTRSNSEQFNALKNQMEKSIKSDAYTKKPVDPDTADAKPADVKPVDAKPAPTPAPAAKAAEAKPAVVPAPDAKAPEKKP
jgi:hypothetical protein